ncbi:MAG: metal dependent phosphohydrolase [Paenibacillus sp.]|jgi:hypothetical protein|nr:metal dependent phosphohydrolase [Paenibacillus sp.]
MSPYQVGAQVFLSSGEKGVVAQINPTSPLRPLIRVIESEGHEPLRSPYDLDLAVNLTTMIV